MKRIWFLIGSFILGAPVRSLADVVSAVASPKIEESSSDQDKAALEAAASDADKWAAAHKNDKPAPAPTPTNVETKGPSDKETPVSPSVASPQNVAPSPSPSVPPSPTPSVAKPSASAPVPHRQGLNEMKGKLQSVGYDPKALRLIVDGGYNVEFSFDLQTSIVNGGERIKIDELGYNDVLIVRYSGKELYAIEIERVSKAPRPE